MKSSLFTIFITALLLLFSNSCLRFDLEHIMLKFGIPQGVYCSFTDERGNDLIKHMVENDSRLLSEKDGIRSTVNSDYYTLKLTVNGADIPIEELTVADNSGYSVIHPITGKETGHTLYFGWKNLFTDELLESKKWRNFNIEYRIVFPKLFKDTKEHIFQCKIIKGTNGYPILSDLTFDGAPVALSNTANFCFIIL